MHTTHDEFLMRMIVARRWTGAEDVAVFELRDATGAELPAWAPGAHIDLRLSGDIVRQYSLCGDPASRDSWQIAVLREAAGRGGSTLIHERLAEGTELDALGPRNNFEFVSSSRYVFIAGGIGITPILPMVASAEAAGATWTLHYGGRTRKSMAFQDELRSSKADGQRSNIKFYAQDEVGLIDLEQALGDPDPDTQIYCCGPEALLGAVEEKVAAARWPVGSLHVERFTPKDQGDPLRAENFEVELSFSGLTVTVPPDRSILEAVEEVGVSVLSSCKEGTCGTCETPVLDGLVDHRDSLLTDEERAANKTMYICVSRAACPRLVLDL